MSEDKNNNIVYFDGICVLCNRFVDFLIRIDKRKILKFAPLKGQTAKQNFSPDKIMKMDSVAFSNAQGVYYKSAAVLKILNVLGGGWKLFNCFHIFPAFIRDAFYDFVAKRRYGWFGKRDTCRIPDEGEGERFLD